jgi:hypothetical protein
VDIEGRASDIFDDPLGIGFRCHRFSAHLRKSKAKMSQQPLPCNAPKLSQGR